MTVITHSQNTKAFQVILCGWDHQCQNQPVKNTFVHFKLIKAFQVGVQSCNVVRDKIKLLCLQSTSASIMGWNCRNFWYDNLGELYTVSECWLILWSSCIVKCFGDTDSSIICKGYAMWTKKSVNINIYPLWGCTFAHRAGYHTRNPVQGLKKDTFPMRGKKTQTNGQVGHQSLD